MNRREFLMTAAAAGLAGCATSGDKACAAKAGSCGGKILFGACRPLKDAAVLKKHGYDFFETSVAGILKPTCSEEEWKKQKDLILNAPIPLRSCNGFIPGTFRITGPKADFAPALDYAEKALRRAGIPICYSAGFSPHQIMSFAAPLGVGLESNGEYMDIECHSVTTSQDMINRLNAVSAPGIEVTSVKLLPEKAPNAMASVAAAAYTVRFREGRAPKADPAEYLHTFLEQEEVIITKETKTGLKEVNIRPGIYQLEVLTACEGSDKAFFMLVDASSAGNIKPATVMEAFLTMMGEELPENALMITREEVYTNAGTEEKGLIPLEQVGADII